MRSPDAIERNSGYIPQPLKEEDIPSLLRLEREAFPVDYWDECAIREEFKANPEGFAVIKESSEVIAYVHLQVGYERTIGREGPATDGLIGSLAVSQTYQGRGFGKELLRLAVFRLRNFGVQRIVLGTRVSNIPMIVLASKIGFKPVGITFGYYRDGEDQLDMALDQPKF